MNNIIKITIYTLIFCGLNLPAYALTAAQTAAQIKHARQLMQDMSQTASRIAKNSPRAQTALSSGATGAMSSRDISSPLPTKWGSVIETVPIKNSNIGGVSSTKGVMLTRAEAVAKARFYARKKILADQRALEADGTDSYESIVWLTLFSLLFI